ncbi:MAG: hypothetical protein RIR70_190 [Pseudomonadota bacterium]|jgi:nucleotide-binding universal stress UspA family protein
MSAPIELKHDDLGRVVSAKFVSAAPLPSDAEPWLVAIDGSKQSLHALEEAVKLAAAARLSVSLVTVLPWRSKEASIDLPHQGWAQLADAAARLDEAGLPWQAFAVMDEPAAGILACAKDLAARVIVIGSHGRGAVEAMLMGSVALEVLHHAKVSVMVVRS